MNYNMWLLSLLSIRTNYDLLVLQELFRTLYNIVIQYMLQVYQGCDLMHF